MQTYQLDNPAMDDEFLRGKPVLCKVVIPDQKEKIKKGDSLVIVLSTGKKFKGRIIEVHFFNLNQYTVGELEIIRQS